MRGILRRLLFWKRDGGKTAQDEAAPEEKKSFQEYARLTPRIVTLFRRQRGIARREMELLVMDNGGEPAWRIEGILERLLPEPRAIYLATDRPEAFAELEETAMDEYGLPLVLLENDRKDGLPGNVALDLNDWEKHLDIMTEVGYNTLIQGAARKEPKDGLEGV